jgi:hypothetical protein
MTAKVAIPPVAWCTPSINAVTVKRPTSKRPAKKKYWHGTHIREVAPTRAIVMLSRPNRFTANMIQKTYWSLLSIIHDLQVE